MAPGMWRLCKCKSNLLFSYYNHYNLVLIIVLSAVRFDRFVCKGFTVWQSIIEHFLTFSISKKNNQALIGARRKPTSEILKIKTMVTLFSTRETFLSLATPFCLKFPANTAFDNLNRWQSVQWKFHFLLRFCFPPNKTIKIWCGYVT